MQKTMRSLFGVLGVLMGAITAYTMPTSQLNPYVFLPDVFWSKVLVYTLCMMTLGLIFYFLYPTIYKRMEKIGTSIERAFDGFQLSEILFSLFGFIVGLVIATLISFAFTQIPFVWVRVISTIAAYIIFGYLGATLPGRKKDELVNAFRNTLRSREEKDVLPAKRMSKKRVSIASKVVDTSALIDGRMVDVVKSGFLEGCLVIPVFVVKELQTIADSADSLKREKGRRGLDVINELQQIEDLPIQIVEDDYPDLDGVDEKLLHFAKDHKCDILTLDYNLNKVAQVQGLSVLNLNELSNAVKPILLPGEERNVYLIKEGKESAQAIAYLEDGTMIVVENGRRYLHQNVNVVVSSVLQTAAGRMIFARVKQDKRR
ncbi:MAG: PIN/TRAM domain-containing protein [Eubacteriaceae bacterium]|jgi:uncharacterized protein YacL|nr:PIN/TRAM domain-containing protein [Eubacteriaceae bacterium]